MTLAW